MHMGNLLRSAGFTEVETNVLQVPMCGWPTGKYPLPFEIVFSGWSHVQGSQHTELSETVLLMLFRLDARLRRAGVVNRENIQRTLSAQALYLFTEKLGYGLEYAGTTIEGSNYQSTPDEQAGKKKKKKGQNCANHMSHVTDCHTQRRKCFLPRLGKRQTIRHSRYVSVWFGFSRERHGAGLPASAVSVESQSRDCCRSCSA